MKISQDIKLGYDDVLLLPQRSILNSRSEVNLYRKFKFYHSPREFYGIPLCSANMSCVSGFGLAEALQQHKIVTCLHKYIDLSELANKFISKVLDPEFVWVSIGLSDEDIDQVKWLESQIDFSPNIIVDVANGYMDRFIKFCSKVRLAFPKSIIFGGNVCTPEIVQELILTSMDGVKIGIGEGYGCTSRAVAAVGYPSISMIDECSHAAHGLKSGDGRLGLVMADGGLKHSGDMSKGYCAGADFLMGGQLFSGHCENSDVCEWEENEQGEMYALYYGMSSHLAQKKNSQEIKDYRASEGTIKRIPYKGSVNSTIQELLGGLRSTAAYIGANCLADFEKCASFIRVNNIHQNYGKQELGK